MVKKLILASAAMLALGGCVAVPVYESAPAGGYYGSYYGAPAATFSFGYQHRSYDGGHSYHNRGHSHHNRGRR
jgi:hypothetical protein